MSGFIPTESNAAVGPSRCAAVNERCGQIRVMNVMNVMVHGEKDNAVVILR